jgi:hypothetical protein
MLSDGEETRRGCPGRSCCGRGRGLRSLGGQAVRDCQIFKRSLGRRHQPLKLAPDEEESPTLRGKSRLTILQGAARRNASIRFSLRGCRENIRNCVPSICAAIAGPLLALQLRISQ